MTLACATKRIVKATPGRPRVITLRHTGSGAVKHVEYLGILGRKAQALIHWPIAGSYVVDLETGKLFGSAQDRIEQLRAWQVIDQDQAFLKSELDLARAKSEEED